jgi:hypothetical protein
VVDGAIAQEAGGALPVLTADDPLFRVIVKKKYLEPGKLSEAFMLRTNETGLSVCCACRAFEAQAIANLDSEGVAELTHGGVTGLLLRVVADGPNHAEIRGIPFKDANAPEAEAEAERFANALAGIVRSVLHIHFRKPK